MFVSEMEKVLRGRVRLTLGGQGDRTGGNLAVPSACAMLDRLLIVTENV
ncbi:hypothetical protein [Roseibium aquae]|nr:hypothetical protein [Roseibium aquae]